MGRLVDMEGNPLAWPELHARREAYYAAREDTFVSVRELCQWRHCRNTPNGRFCAKHHAWRRARVGETVTV